MMNLNCVELTPLPLEGARPCSDKLTALRMRYPTLTIQPAPQHVRAINLQAGVVRDVQLPDGAQLVQITYAAQATIYVTTQGQAQVPAAGNDTYTPGVLVNPIGWYDCSELRQLSMIAPANTIVSVHVLI